MCVLRVAQINRSSCDVQTGEALHRAWGGSVSPGAPQVIAARQETT